MQLLIGVGETPSCDLNHWVHRLDYPYCCIHMPVGCDHSDRVSVLCAARADHTVGGVLLLTTFPARGHLGQAWPVGIALTGLLGFLSEAVGPLDGLSEVCLLKSFVIISYAVCESDVRSASLSALFRYSCSFAEGFCLSTRAPYVHSTRFPSWLTLLPIVRADI
jgi:hypothetical protein